MVIYLKQGDPNLMQGLQSFGQGLGQYQRRQNEQTALKQVLGGLPENPTQQNILQAAIEASKQGVPFEKFSALGNLFPKPLAGGMFQNVEYVSEKLQQAGLSKEEADQTAAYMSVVPRGAQTEITKKFLDKKSRSEDVDTPDLPETTDELELAQRQKANLMTQENFKGLNAKERAEKSSKYEEKNIEKRAKAAESFREYENTMSVLNRMEKLNNEAKFPTVFSKPFVLDKEGNLRAPEITDPTGAIQEYTKLVNGFQSRAKNLYGANVTGFELSSFMTMLPTLSNSPEGRKRIINSMKIQTEIDSVINKEIKKIHEEYGYRRLNNAQVEELAEKKAAPQLEKLRQEFQDQGIGDIVMMRGIGPDGKEIDAPVLIEDVEKAMKKGFKRI